MEKIKAFWPAGLEDMWHRSADGKTEYRLDTIEKRVRLKQLLEQDPLFEIVEISEGDYKLWHLAHSEKYIKALRTGHPLELAQSSGIMWHPHLPRVYENSAEAMVQACHAALQTGFALTIGEGGHHTTEHRGYGFGPINEVAIACKKLRNFDFDMRIAVLDTDVHVGNGNQSLLAKATNVLLVDIWNKILPKWKLGKPVKNIISMEVKDVEEYFSALRKGLQKLLEFKPNLLIYYCGIDVLESDRLGGIPGFTEEKLWEREKLISDFIQENKVPTVFVSGGGYINHSDPEKAEQQMQKAVEIYKKIILGFVKL